MNHNIWETAHLLMFLQWACTGALHSFTVELMNIHEWKESSMCVTTSTTVGVISPSRTRSTSVNNISTSQSDLRENIFIQWLILSDFGNHLVRVRLWITFIKQEWCSRINIDVNSHCKNSVSLFCNSVFIYSFELHYGTLISTLSTLDVANSTLQFNSDFNWHFSGLK